MIELHTMLSLLILLLISLMTNRTSLVLLGLFVVCWLGIWLLRRYQRRLANNSASLTWCSYLILGLVLLVVLDFLALRPVVNTFHLGLLLAIGWGVILSRFVTSWHKMGQPPSPARDLKLTAETGCIQVGWTPPDDPRYAESLLVRSPATFAPAHPNQGKVLCRGVLCAWRDSEVEPGQPYAYMVFTHNGRGRYHSTPGQRIYARAARSGTANRECNE